MYTRTRSSKTSHANFDSMIDGLIDNARNKSKNLLRSDARRARGCPRTYDENVRLKIFLGSVFGLTARALSEKHGPSQPTIRKIVDEVAKDRLGWITIARLNRQNTP